MEYIGNRYIVRKREISKERFFLARMNNQLHFVEIIQLVAMQKRHKFYTLHPFFYLYEVKILT